MGFLMSFSQGSYELLASNRVSRQRVFEKFATSSTGLSAVEFYWGIHGHKSFICSITQKLDHESS